MHDTYLLNKLSNSLKEICEDNKIKRLYQFTVSVNHHSHVNEESLREYLEIHNKDIVGDGLQINVQREEIEDLTAIIYNLQGDTVGL